VTDKDIDDIEKKLGIVETHEDGYDLLWAISDLIAEIRRLKNLYAEPGTGISKELFDSVCAERDALYEEVSELKRSRDIAPTVYFLPGPDSWTDERIHGVTHSAKVIDIKKLSEF